MLAVISSWRHRGPTAKVDQLPPLAGDCPVLALGPCPGDPSVPGKQGQLVTLQRPARLRGQGFPCFPHPDIVWEISGPRQPVSGSYHGLWAALGIQGQSSQEKGGQRGSEKPETEPGPTTF